MEALKHIMPDSKGLSPELLGHADRLWKMLDNMAESDPEAYKKFIEDQAKAAGVSDLSKKPAAAAVPTLLMHCALVTPPNAKRVLISLWRDTTGALPAATVRGSEQISAATSQWQEVDIRFRARQPPFASSARDGVGMQVVELHCHPGVLALAAAGTPAVLRAVLAEAALRHVEHVHGLRLDRRTVSFQVAREALPEAELKAAEQLMAQAAVKQAADETLPNRMPSSLLSELSRIAVPAPLTAPAAASPVAAPATKASAGPKKPLIQELS